MRCKAYLHLRYNVLSEIISVAIPMTDLLRVHMLKAGKTFEGTTAEVCEQLGKQIESELNGQKA